jgi:hypothetical protein
MLHDRTLWPDDWCNSITNHLKNVGITDKIVIRRYQEISRFLPLLKIGTTKDFFQTAGKMPVDKDRLNRSVNGALKTETNLLSMDDEMSSDPGRSLHPAPKWPPQLLSA